MTLPWRELRRLSDEIELLQKNTPPQASLLCCTLNELGEKVRRRKQSIWCVLPSHDIALFWSRLKSYKKASYALSLLHEVTASAAQRVQQITESEQAWMLEELRQAVGSQCDQWRDYFNGAGSDIVREEDAEAECGVAKAKSQAVAAFAQAIDQLESTSDLLQQLHGRTSGRHRRSLRQLQRRLSALGPSDGWHADLDVARKAITSDNELSDTNPKLEQIVEGIDRQLESVGHFFRVLLLEKSMPDELKRVIPTLDESIDEDLQRVADLRKRREDLDPENDDNDDVMLLYTLADEVKTAEANGRDLSKRRSDALIACVNVFRSVLIDSGVTAAHAIDAVPSPAMVSAGEFEKWHEHTGIVLDRFLTRGRERSHELVDHVSKKQKHLRERCITINSQLVTDAVLADARALLARIDRVGMPDGLPGALLALEEIDRLAEDIGKLDAAAQEVAARWTNLQEHVRRLQEKLAQAREAFTEVGVAVPPAPPKVVESVPLEPQEQALRRVQRETERITEDLRERIAAKATSWRGWLDRAGNVLPQGPVYPELPTTPESDADILQWAKWAQAHESLLEKTGAALKAFALELVRQIGDASSALVDLMATAEHHDNLMAKGLLEDAKRLSPDDDPLKWCERLLAFRQGLSTISDQLAADARRVTDLRDKITRRMRTLLEGPREQRAPRVLFDRVVGLLAGTSGDLVERSRTQIVEQLRMADHLLTSLEVHAWRAVRRE